MGERRRIYKKTSITDEKDGMDAEWERQSSPKSECAEAMNARVWEEKAIPLFD